MCAPEEDVAVCEKVTVRDGVEEADVAPESEAGGIAELVRAILSRSFCLYAVVNVVSLLGAFFAALNTSNVSKGI